MMYVANADIYRNKYWHCRARSLDFVPCWRAQYAESSVTTRWTI